MRWRRAAQPDDGHLPRLAAARISGRLASALEGRLRVELATDPDAAMDAGRSLKDDASARVVRLGPRDRAVVVKRFRYPDALRAARRALRRSRARSAFHAGLALGRLGFPVAPVLGHLECRRWGCVVASWLVTEWIEGTELPAALAEASVEERRALVERAVELVSALAVAGIAHGDLKATNLLVAPDGGLVLLDLHAVRAGASRRALRRDRDRFLRNLAPWPELEALARGRIPR